MLFLWGCECAEGRYKKVHFTWNSSEMEVQGKGKVLVSSNPRNDTFHRIHLTLLNELSDKRMFI